MNSGFAVLLLAYQLSAASVPLQPDPKLTPGVTDSSATIKNLCTPGYTATIRFVSERTKSEVFKRYGIPRDGAKYEVDHYVSLEIGGRNDIENLWPQPWPEARHKDVVETWLHRRMCVGKFTIEQTQILARVWPVVYEAIKSPKKGCHLEDSCGVYPPFRATAEYCGEPEVVCEGERWRGPR